MRPLDETSTGKGNLDFGRPFRERMPVAALLLALALGAAAAARWHLLQAVAPQLAWGAAAALLLAALVAAAYQTHVRLDLDDGTYVAEQTLGPFRRGRRGRLDELPLLELVHNARDPEAGGGGRRYMLQLRGDGHTVRLFGPWSDPHAVETAYRIAARLKRPLTELAATGGLAPLQHATIAVMWGGMLCVVLVMLWPLVSGQRRIRASADDAPASRNTTQRFQRGLQEYQLHRPREAEAQFRAVLRDAPDWYEAYNMLAYAFADQGKLDAALNAAETAARLSADRPYILDTVAEMHERRREFDSAIEYYERALRGMGGVEAIETNCKFGRTLVAAGQRDRGLRYLREAARYPAQPFGEQAVRLLKQLETPGKPARPVTRTR